MTASTEATARDELDRRERVSRWRERAAGEQESALPPGSVAVTCSAPLGAGGLGRHVEEILDALARR
ncbi:MAG TPA: hypothetical protein VN889_05780, partial [Solirubrobacteraceae bacterium]|nr:hypothetical protein [Solirubrobacteraceae bacterium]